MTLNNLIDQLNAIQTVADKLAAEIDNGDSYVRVYFESGEISYFTLKIFTSDDLTDEKYIKEFDRAEDLLAHLQTLLIGARLANGLEV